MQFRFMQHWLRGRTGILGPCMTLLLSACWGDGGDDSAVVAPAPTSYSISATVSGLAAGASVTLQNNAADMATRTLDGRFSFATPVAAGGGYAVTVSAQPSGQTCTVSNGTGSGVSANVANVQITCSATTYNIGGTVSGLAAGASLAVQNNGADALTRTADGSFSFATPVAAGGSYAVTVSSQPSGQTCTVSNGTGSGVSANVLTVQITCSATTYTIGGTVSGLASSTSITLQNNAADATTLNANGSFSFATPVATGGSYAVTVGTQPAGQVCTVSNGTGSGLAANVANVQITCSAASYTIGGTVSGLASGASVTLQNNAANPTTRTLDGSFSFTTPVVANGSYAVTVSTQPLGQTCTVSNGTGAGLAANVANVAVACVNRARFAYVVNSSGNNVSQYNVDAGGTLTALSPATVSAGAFPFSVTVDPTGRYAYVANVNGNSVSQYRVDSSGGLIALSPATVGTGAGPASVAVDPTGRYAYVANSTGTTVSQYSIGSGGVLTALSPATVATGFAPFSITIDPTGRYAYLVNNSGNTVSQYGIGSGGALTALSPATVATGSFPFSVAIDPTGRYAYVVNNNADTVSQYSVSGAGVLTPLGTPTVATGDSPYSVTIDPTGRYAYVANSLDDTVSQYAIGAGGELTALSPATVGAGSSPVSVTVDPTGLYVYVANNGDDTVSQYRIGTGGVLSLLSPAAVPGGNGPQWVTTTFGP